MAQQIIGLGALANDGTGDKLRIGGDKINDNFTELYGKIASDNFVIVKELADLPTPVSNVITLINDTTYFFTSIIDLLGDRIVLGDGTVLLGTSSFNAGIISTGAISYLLTSSYSVNIVNMNLESSEGIFSFIGNPLTDNVFINNCTLKNSTTTTSIIDYSSIIFDSCSFIDFYDVEFDGDIGTLSFNNCLISPSATSAGLNVLSTATITRRFRITYSSFVIQSGANGIFVDLTANIPDESYILDTCNFSGTGTYLSGVTETSNKALFSNCKGINNTSVIGQAYMQGNATATVIAAPSTFVKVAGTTTAGSNNSKYTHTNNRLQCDATIERKYLVLCNLSFTSGNNQVCEFGFYDSEIPGIRPASRTIVTTNGAGIAENVSFTAIVSHAYAEYLEVHCANNTSATNITVTSMNFTITEIK